MKSKSRRGVVCLSLVAGFLLAPSSQRPPLNPYASAILIRADQSETADTEPVDLNTQQGPVCSGTPDFTGKFPIHKSPQADAPVFEKDRKHTVLSLIRYPWQDLGYDIVFMGARPGYRAMTLTAKRRIEIYVRPGEGVMNQAYDLAHELGHAFDLKYNDDERRHKWMEMRGIKSSTPWFGCDACPDYRTPAGDFAETFAYLLLGPGNYHSVIAPMPNIDRVEELARFCKIDQLSEVLAAHLPKKAPAKVQSARIEKRAVPVNKTESSAAVAKSTVVPEVPAEAGNPAAHETTLIDEGADDVPAPALEPLPSSSPLMSIPEITSAK